MNYVVELMPSFSFNEQEREMLAVCLKEADFEISENELDGLESESIEEEFLKRMKAAEHPRMSGSEWRRLKRELARVRRRDIPELIRTLRNDIAQRERLDAWIAEGRAQRASA